MKKENRVLQFLTSKKARSYLLIAVLVVALYVVFNLLIGAGVINRYYEGIVNGHLFQLHDKTYCKFR